MAWQASLVKKVFQFGFKARTSRGLMRDKTSWFIKLWDDAMPEVFGIGECAPLPGLSVDAVPDYEKVLEKVIQDIPAFFSTHNVGQCNLHDVVPAGFPSILFGLETARQDFIHGGKRLIFENEFVKGKIIPINGLIWMGDMDFMMDQISKKIAAGFRCIKLKVGGLDFDRECDVLHYIRKRYYREDITIRLDANGAFKAEDVLFRLDQLATFNIHSIEQPIKPGQDVMEELCRKSPIPIAFDEELIGIDEKQKKVSLLERLKPRYIILKPTLHGGFSGCAEWIAIAESMGIGWWITSALESNIGLNAICQFTANYSITIPQGLGTGGIYENNFPSPLRVEAGEIRYIPEHPWSIAF